MPLSVINVIPYELHYGEKSLTCDHCLNYNAFDGTELVETLAETTCKLLSEKLPFPLDELDYKTYELGEVKDNLRVLALAICV